MGFFSGLGAALGVGGAQIHIEIPTNQFALGTSIQGNIVLTGGNRPQVMNRLLLEIRLRQYVIEGVIVDDWWGYDYAEYPVSCEDTIAVAEFGHGQPIAPGQQLEWPFALDIPIDSIPSQFGVEYGLVATADIPGSLDSVSALPIQILPVIAAPVMMAPPPQPMMAPPPMAGVFNPESRVMALWTDGAWYGAEVAQFDPASGQYFVNFDDGSQAWVPAQSVQPVQMPFPPGTWVQAPWEGTLYPAQILQAVDGWYYLRWQADNSESYVGADVCHPM
ncbi:MAG: sporulation protein [Deltaproteobacteria bacterium]|nr:sporulation protein [Deltaproteobacteria bacterium]